jgi:hypothetical protein
MRHEPDKTKLQNQFSPINEANEAAAARGCHKLIKLSFPYLSAGFMPKLFPAPGKFKISFNAKSFPLIMCLV